MRRAFAVLAASIVVAAGGLPGIGAAQEADHRIIVPLPDEDRARLQEDMREFLRQNTGLLNAVIDGDMDRVREMAQGARPPLPRIRALASGASLPSPDGKNPAVPPEAGGRQRPLTLFERMQRNLPQPFKDMLLGMRETVAEIERDAREIGDSKHTLRQLSTIQGLCVSCHDLYKVVSKPPGAPNLAEQD
ncbi:hypothetical protein [Propionivibrio sp.]|uniref:hypothetical protein n=1 Tax=Propionivibrio sp. TaxID=2212460 RepID=UPI0039E48BDD